MRPTRTISAIFLACLLCAKPIHAQEAPPETLILDGNAIAEARKLMRESGETSPALAALKRNADQALTRGPWTVVSKKQLPPSGNKHDYMSVVPYWWPDPEKPDGLPYIRRDGKVNPERNDYDNTGLAHTQPATATRSPSHGITRKIPVTRSTPPNCCAPGFSTLKPE